MITFSLTITILSKSNHATSSTHQNTEQRITCFFPKPHINDDYINVVHHIPQAKLNPNHLSPPMSTKLTTKMKKWVGEYLPRAVAGGEHTQVRWKKGGREREGPMSDLYTCLVVPTCLARQPCRTVGVGATRMPCQPSRWLYANGLVSVAALSHHM